MSDKTLKVCFVSPLSYVFFSKDAARKVGGAEKQMYLLGKNLSIDPMFDVHFLVADFGQKEIECQDSISLWKSFRYQSNPLVIIYNLFKTLKKIDADIYVFRSAHTGIAIAVMIVKILLRKKSVYMLAHDAEINFKKQKQTEGLLTALLMKYVYQQSNCVTVQSVYQQDAVKKYRKRNPLLIKNIFKIQTREQIEKKEYLLWVGRIIKFKQPEKFLQLARQFPDEKFVMIAPPDKYFIEEHKKIRQRADKIKNLDFIDFVPPQDMPRYFLKAKVYVLSSYAEGFSNTMLEAMAAGCPILSLNVNPDNILEKYNSGFCAYNNQKKFITLLEKLIKNQDLRKQTGANGQQYVSDNHAPAPIIKQFKTLLKNVWNNRNKLA